MWPFSLLPFYLGTAFSSGSDGLQNSLMLTVLLCEVAPPHQLNCKVWFWTGLFVAAVGYFHFKLERLPSSCSSKISWKSTQLLSASAIVSSSNLSVCLMVWKGCWLRKARWHTHGGRVGIAFWGECIECLHRKLAPFVCLWLLVRAPLVHRHWFPLLHVLGRTMSGFIFWFFLNCRWRTACQPEWCLALEARVLQAEYAIYYFIRSVFEPIFVYLNLHICTYVYRYVDNLLIFKNQHTYLLQSLMRHLPSLHWSFLLRRGPFK